MSKPENEKTVQTTPPIPEVVGISTAVDQITAVQSRLVSAIIAASATDKDLEKFRKELDAMPPGLMKNHLTAHKAELEADIAGNAQKAVSEALREVQAHIGTIQTLASQIQAKHGKPSYTVKRADKGTGTGDITSGNMDALQELMTARGIAVQFELQEDGKHYIAHDPATGRKSKYAVNLRSDW